EPSGSKPDDPLGRPGLRTPPFRRRGIHMRFNVVVLISAALAMKLTSGIADARHSLRGLPRQRLEPRRPTAHTSELDLTTSYVGSTGNAATAVILTIQGHEIHRFA